MSTDSQAWLGRFVKALDDFIWVHSGGSASGLNIVYRNALNLMSEYRSEQGVLVRAALARYSSAASATSAADSTCKASQSARDATFARDNRTVVQKDLYGEVLAWAEYHGLLELDGIDGWKE